MCLWCVVLFMGGLPSCWETPLYLFLRQVSVNSLNFEIKKIKNTGYYQMLNNNLILTNFCKSFHSRFFKKKVAKRRANLASCQKK